MLGTTLISTGRFTVTAALALCVLSAAFVTVTVSVCCVVTEAGAVYRPVWSILPILDAVLFPVGVIDQLMVGVVNPAG